MNKFKNDVECNCGGNDREEKVIESCKEKECTAWKECEDTLQTLSCVNYKQQGFCTNPGYKDWLQTNCAMTCEFCKVEQKCGVPLARKDKNDGSIVGGQATFKAYYPWQTTVERKCVNGRKWEIFCGGTLIDKRRVISAAHCFIPPAFYEEDNCGGFEYRVTLGEHKLSEYEDTEQSIEVDWIQDHPEYDSNINNDISILFLKKSAKYNKFVTPACLPEVDEIVPAGQKCNITGTSVCFRWHHNSHNAISQYKLAQCFNSGNSKLGLVPNKYLN